MKSSISLFLAIPLVGGLLGAQMSGTYSFDPQGSGSRNYTVMNQLTFDLATKGINAPVTVLVADGMHAVDFFLAPIPGATKQQTVTFRGSKPLAAGFQTRNGGADAILSAQDYGAAQPIQGLVFEGLRFDNPQYASRIYNAMEFQGPVRDLRIEGCEFLDLNLSFLGQTESLSLVDNVLRARGTRGPNVLVYRSSGLRCHGNELECQDRGGLTLREPSGGLAPNRIYNNLLYGARPSGFDEALIHLETADNVLVEHNTVLVTDPQAAAACVVVGGRVARPVTIRNNIFVQLGRGSMARFTSTSPQHHISEANIFWGTQTSVPFAVIGGSTYPDLASFRQLGLDSHSQSADPLLADTRFVSVDLRLKAGSPAVGAARNTSADITTDFGGATRLSPTSIGAYEGLRAISLTPYGTGCAGQGGFVPQIGSTGQHSYGSTDFRVTLSKALGSLGGRAFLSVGVSDQSWVGTTLPLQLGGGCALLASPDLILPATVSGGFGAGQGTAAVNFLVPNNPQLGGKKLYLQWAVVDPAAAGIGLAFSDAAVLAL